MRGNCLSADNIFQMLPFWGYFFVKAATKFCSLRLKNYEYSLQHYPGHLPQRNSKLEG